MMIEQFHIIGSGMDKVTIGKRGKRRYYAVSQLKDPEKYSITCEPMSKSTRLEIVNEARAMAMWGRAPMKYILRDILKVEDPDGWMRQMELEQARSADPVLAIMDMAVRYAEEADEVTNEIHERLLRLASQRLTERGVAMIQASRQPMTEVPEKVKAPQVDKVSPDYNVMGAMMGQGTPGRPMVTGGELT